LSRSDVDVAHHDGRTFGREQSCGRFTDATTGTSDESNLALGETEAERKCGADNLVGLLTGERPRGSGIIRF
jgi:hypothetical protein